MTKRSPAERRAIRRKVEAFRAQGLSDRGIERGLGLPSGYLSHCFPAPRAEVLLQQFPGCAAEVGLQQEADILPLRRAS